MRLDTNLNGRIVVGSVWHGALVTMVVLGVEL